MMLLTKRCYKKDHVFKRENVKLGTLSYYRTHEHLQTRDPYEGRTVFNITIERPIWMEKRWINTLCQGCFEFGKDPASKPVLFPGKSSGHVDYLETGGRTDSTIEITRAQIAIDRTTIDSLIFCMSIDDCGDEEIGNFDYDSSWSIIQDEAVEFAKELATSLHRLISTPDRGGLISENHNPLELTVYCEHGPVTYANKDIIINNDSKICMDPLTSQMRYMSHIKPTSFSNELEYRFMLIIHKNGTYIPFRKNIAFLPISDEWLGRIFTSADMSD